SLVHGVAVLAACVGVVLFWKNTEDEQSRSLQLTRQLTEAELSRRRFTSELLVNLARRNQNLLYRQLDLLNNLEEKEHDPDALADLFRLDHLATRIRRNAESLLVLSGEEAPRTWGSPVLLVDVVRAAIAETEDLDRVDFAVDESLAVSGRAVADCTHLLAELVENAVQFSPPGMSVMIRTRAYLPQPGAQVLTVEDWGVGMSRTDLDEANDVLRRPRQFDLAVSQRLGLHVVARLAQRYKITVSLEATPGGGVTAVMILPVHLFLSTSDEGGTPPRRDPGRRPFATTPLPPGTLPTTPAGPGSNGHGPNGHAANGRSRASVLDLPPPLTPDPAPAPEPLDEPTAGAAGVGWLGVGGPDVLPERLPAPRADAAASATTAPTELPPSAPSAPSAPAAPAVDGTTVVNGAAADWRSWWTMPLQPEADQRTTRPDPLLDPLDELGDLGALGDLTGDELTGPAALGGLARRTPQASLADELRRTGDRDLPAPQAPSRDAVRANSALSRFQANQRAAREADGGEDRR
ncbi:MAG TPA: ATP-binding protein, partial [Mycobacteriales bacterium]